MKKKLPTIALAAIFSTVIMENCTKETPNQFKIVSVSTDAGVDLNGSQLATSVPLNSSVIITFDRAVDTTQANLKAISLNANGAVVPTKITASGLTATVTPKS